MPDSPFSPSAIAQSVHTTLDEAEAAKILTQARAEVDNRLKNARHELTEYAGELATQRAAQLLREKITDADQKKLFDQSVREVEEVRS